MSYFEEPEEVDRSQNIRGVCVRVCVQNKSLFSYNKQ